MSDLLNSASLVMIPSGYKEDTVYSVVPSDGSGDLSFTRASNGTRVNSAGLVEVVPWNLATDSEDFTSGWPKTATITANTTANPINGAINADTITGSGFIGKNIASIGVNTFFVYAKANSASVIRLNVYDGSTDRGADYNLLTGAISGIYGSPISTNAENVGNGWWKISITTNNANYSYVQIHRDSSGTCYIWGAQLNIGSTAKPYFPTTDRLNVPRLTYQNGGGGCPSLLLEKQSTNLLTNSQTTNAWSLTNMSRTANYGISPDGTQNADLLFPTTSGSVLFTTDTTTSSLVIGEPFVVSFFIKLNASFISNVGTNIFDIRLSGASVWSRPTIRVNLETGEVTNQNNASYISSTNFGNGWFRITFGATPTGTSGVVALQAPTGSTMNGGSFYIWGLQGEANATYATSYIPTTSSSATRVADACFKAGISSLIGQSEGFIAGEVEGLTNSYGSQSTIMSVSDGTTANRIMFSFNASTGYVTPRIFKAGSTIFVNDFSITLTQKIKFAIGWGGGRAVCYVNGTQVQETTGLTFFSSGTLTRFGADDGAGSNIGIGKVSEYILGTANLTNAQLQSLTL